MNKEWFRKMEVAGIAIVLITSVALQYMNVWTEKNVCAVLFGAVNDSLWEKIKILAMPYVVWSIIELACAKPYFKQYVVSKVTGLYIMTFIMIFLMALYGAFADQENMVVNIVIALISTILAHVASYNMTLAQGDFRKWFAVAIFLLLLYFTMYFSFTAAPPHLGIFKDPGTGLYGIPDPWIDAGAFFLSI